MLEPLPRVLARLTGKPLTTTATCFGPRVGTVDDDDNDDAYNTDDAASDNDTDRALDAEFEDLLITTAPPDPPPPSPAPKASVPCSSTLASERASWVSTTLSELGGVLTAWPSTAAGLKGARVNERVRALPSDVPSGKACWWLDHLRRTGFSKEDSHLAASDRGAVTGVYRVGGATCSWFPAGSTYGISPGGIDAFLHFGIAATVHELELHGRVPSRAAQLRTTVSACHMQLDAAAHGDSPAVLAAMLVCAENDDNVRGVLTLTQVHTFRLSEMLNAYTEMGPEENRTLAQQEVVGAVRELSERAAALASRGVLKLNMTPENVVFCPELAETSDCDEWEVRGFGFVTREFDVVQGRPLVCDFDARLCHSVDGIDASAAHVLSMLVLLAAARHAHGVRAHAVVSAALREDALLTGRLRELSCAPERIERFVATLRDLTHGTRVERDALPTEVFACVGDDFAALLRTGVKALDECDDSRFAPLLRWACGARLARTSSSTLLLSEEEEPLANVEDDEDGSTRYALAPEYEGKIVPRFTFEHAMHLRSRGVSLEALVAAARRLGDRDLEARIKTTCDGSITSTKEHQQQQ